MSPCEICGGKPCVCLGSHMNPVIIRLRRTQSFDTTPSHWYFRSIEKAKWFAQQQCNTIIEWGRGCNEYLWDNDNWLSAGHGGHCYNYSIEPITIIEDKD